MARIDPAIDAHLEWIDFVQPTGLVVSAPALVRAGAILDRRDAEGQQRLSACVDEHTFDPQEGPVSRLPDFRAFAAQVLDWSFSPKGYAGIDGCPMPPELEAPFPEYGETLRPDVAVRELDPQNGALPWQLLVRVLGPNQNLNQSQRGPGGLEASAHGRMERLLRHTGVSAGLLFNGRTLRLISAPRGESSGWLDFRVSDMLPIAGRPICTALRLLLNERRLLSLSRHERLAALLEDSRKFQNEVSERLAEQVLHALYEFVRGFQAAHDASGGVLLSKVLGEHPEEVYRALLTVMMRLVFLLYAEKRNMLPEDETFLRYYSIAGLYERLREDAALYPDTMDQRYGAWAQLLVLFRMLHDGATWGDMHLPKRPGVLFDPDRFPFLEGRPLGSTRLSHERTVPPLVPDGTIYRALDKLLVLDGERISYRALDVEQIGSVYETMMGFRLETAVGLSASIKAAKKHGAPTTIDLEMLLIELPAQRRKWLQDRTDRQLTDRVHKAVREAESIEALHAALEPVLDKNATPDLVPMGAMVLQPSEERRRSGSHYTPRTLTEPIVRTTLEPIIAWLRGEGGQPPRPDQILDLKICDPAMGSGAFLVETCRQLGDALIEAWHAHGKVPALPSGEDEVVFARRLIAQRCLYGVDRNPVAVDLAKVSLWLVTLAKDHALTFLDHALRHGDSLVGLWRKQIEAFHWDPDAPRFQAGFETMRVRECVENVSELRQLIREAGESVAEQELRDLWDEAQSELSKIRFFGDLIITSFFEGAKRTEREAKRAEYADAVVNGDAEQYRGGLEERRYAATPLAPFYWDIEFPEVFEGENPGFDAIVGNPPFAGSVEFALANLTGYTEFCRYQHSKISGKADQVAYFFRRAYVLLRKSGAFGLIATNTIGQGDTRESGLTQILADGATIFSATRRRQWPGKAAVIVSAVHVSRGLPCPKRVLDGKPVERISAYLFPGSLDEDPLILRENLGRASKGIVQGGNGFFFDDTDTSASPLADFRRIKCNAPKEATRIKPFIDGSELCNLSEIFPSRQIIDMNDLEEESELLDWPELTEILKHKVLPFRLEKKQQAQAKQLRKWWWRWAFSAASARACLTESGFDRYFAKARLSNTFAFVALDANVVPSEQIVFLVLSQYCDFALLQSRIHEVWARFFGSSMGDTLRYVPSRCFDPFPFPYDIGSSLETAGKAYYEFRAALMVKNDEGLTKTYNRFHDRDERDPDIEKLRELHDAMDRAVLNAYGWNDLPTDCDFFLDYEIDEEEWGNKKKPWHYRWPDDIRDEVLARLLELNAERAKEETRSGAAAGKKRGRKPAAKRAATSSTIGDCFS